MRTRNRVPPIWIGAVDSGGGDLGRAMTRLWGVPSAHWAEVARIEMYHLRGYLCGTTCKADAPRRSADKVRFIDGEPSPDDGPCTAPAAPARAEPAPRKTDDAANATTAGPTSRGQIPDGPCCKPQPDCLPTLPGGARRVTSDMVSGPRNSSLSERQQDVACEQPRWTDARTVAIAKGCRSQQRKCSGCEDVAPDHLQRRRWLCTVTTQPNLRTGPSTARTITSRPCSDAKSVGPTE